MPESEQYRKGTDITSMCTRAYLFASTELLDKKTVPFTGIPQ